MVSILIGVFVLVIVPVMCRIAEANIRTECEAEQNIYAVIKEANKDSVLTRAEMEHVLRMTATSRHPMHLCFYGMESVNNGTFGDYLYRVDEKQLYDILTTQEKIHLPEGGIISVYR